MAEDGPRPSGDPRGIDQQVSGVGGDRPRALGAPWLRHRSCGLARLRLVTRLPRSALPARGRRPRGLHRVGGDAAVEQRQGRDARHLVLRRQPVARGRQAPAPPPGRDHPVGGLQRLLSRSRLPRRHPQRVHEAVGPDPGAHRAARARHSREEEPEHRRVGGGARDAARRRPRQEPHRSSHGPAGPFALRRLAQGALRRSLPGHGPAAVLRQLGRPGHPPARQLQRVPAGVVAAEVARGPRRVALGAVLVGLRPRAPDEVLRSLPGGPRQRLGQDAAGDAERPPSRGEVRAASRARVAAGPHAVDDVLSRSGHAGVDRGAGSARHRGVRRARPGRDVFDDDGPRDRDHRPAGRQALRLVIHRRRRPVPDRPRLRSEWPGAHVLRLDRSARAHRQRLAARVASSPRPEEEHAVAALPSARSRRAVDARTRVRV